MSYYLALISPTDSPIYETYLTSSKPHNQIASSSTSTFPSWSTFPAFNQAQHTQSQQQSQSQAQSKSNTAAPSVPPKDPFPPQFLGTPGTRPPNHTANSSSSQLPSGPPQGIEKHVLQMIAFSSLDIVEEVMGSTGSMYLKMVDKVNEWNVSAFVAPAGEFEVIGSHISTSTQSGSSHTQITPHLGLSWVSRHGSPYDKPKPISSALT